MSSYTGQFDDEDAPPTSRRTIYVDFFINSLGAETALLESNNSKAAANGVVNPQGSETRTDISETIAAVQKRNSRYYRLEDTRRDDD
jgi:hypothetical protein